MYLLIYPNFRIYSTVRHVFAVVMGANSIVITVQARLKAIYVRHIKKNI